MSSNQGFSRAAFQRDSRPLDAARAAFDWLVTGPHPVSIDGRLFPGLPPRRVPLDEVRDRLLRRHCRQDVRDRVWAHLVLRSRTEGATWTVGCVGVALPALTTIAARLSARFAADPSDLHSAVLTGFLAELARIDLRKPRIMLRLRWAAYRCGHTALREALDAPAPAGTGFRSTAPPPPWGHPDFVLARAVAEHVITAAEADLIGDTRLEGVPLATAAEDRGVSYEAAKKTRQRAERRLVAYLAEDTPTVAHAGPTERDLATQATDTVIITEAARAATTPEPPDPVSDTTESAEGAEETGGVVTKNRARLSPQPAETGVQGCGRRPPTSATTAPDQPTTATRRPSSPTPELPRCA